MKIRNLLEQFVVKDVDKAPTRFRKGLRMLMSKHSGIISEYDPRSEYDEGDVHLVFGANGLPTEENTVHIGNKFENKTRQYAKMKGKVNTIKTYTTAIRVNMDKFIAKRNMGERQQGQLINQLPDDPEDYIFQNLVDIVAEFRVLVYYMNGEYHVSGIYKKTGSNVSIAQIPQTGKLGSMVADMAKKSTEIMGYGLGGVDIAVVSGANAKDVALGESVIGKIASGATKMIGKISNLDDLTEDNYVVVLEVNSFPSTSNPAILNDLLQSMNSVRYK